MSNIFTDEAVDAARKVLRKRGWRGPMNEDTEARHVGEALEAADQVQPDPCEGMITMDKARDLAMTYDGGEGNHPLARHRDSMG